GGPGRIAVDVAGASAVGKLARAVELAFLGLRVSVGFEVSGVTPTAGSRIRGSGKYDVFGVGRVTLIAGQGHMMLLGVLGGRMPEIDCIPVGIAMAGRTLARRGHVTGRLANGSGVVVTGSAPSGEGRVIELRRHPGQGA